MPRPKKATQLSRSEEKEPRRGKRQRIAKQRPDFIDPFSLRKKRMATLEPQVLSPFSIVSGESSPHPDDEKLYEEITQSQLDPRSDYLPPRKRICLRVTWPKLALSCSDFEPGSHIKTTTLSQSEELGHLQTPIRVKIPLNITRRRSTRNKHSAATPTSTNIITS